MAVTADDDLADAHAADVAARPVARRLEALRRRQQLGLSHRRAGLQVQPDRHRRGPGHRPTRPRRGNAAGAGSHRPALCRAPWPTWPNWNCRPLRRTASTPGTCSPSACGWSGCGSTATRSSISCASSGVGCSVHWRPLHLHPYYEETFGWRPEHLPVASREWLRLVSLPLFPGMRPEEQQHVVRVVRALCAEHAARLIRRTIMRADLNSPITWPDGKRFAFTVFDDTDWPRWRTSAPVYDFLYDCGFRTTKSCWPFRGDPAEARVTPARRARIPTTCGGCCSCRPAASRSAGTGPPGTACRGKTTVAGLEKFAKCFGHDPLTAANHAGDEKASIGATTG